MLGSHRTQTEVVHLEQLRPGDLIIATIPGRLIIERDRPRRPFWDVGDDPSTESEEHPTS